MRSLDIGLAFDLRPEAGPPPRARAPDDAPGTARDARASDPLPDDLWEEYDAPETIEAVATSLAALGHRPRRLGGGRAFLEALLAEPPQLVFNLAEGRGSRSREAHVPAACEMLGVPYTHSDPLTMALTLDKAMAKRVVRAAGVPTAPFAVVETAAEASLVDLPFPLFVKPVAEGSSMGVRVSSRVQDPAALQREVERCLGAYRQPVLVEAWLPGAEVTVAVRGQGRSARVIGAMEIAPADGRSEDFVYGLETKRDFRRQVRYHVPPRTPSPEQRAEVERAALAAYRALGCRDIARVDLRLDAAGRANFVEVNPLPGLNPGYSDVCIMAEHLGMRFEALIGGIVDEAVLRHPGLA